MRFRFGSPYKRGSRVAAFVATRVAPPPCQPPVRAPGRIPQSGIVLISPLSRPVFFVLVARGVPKVGPVMWVKSHWQRDVPLHPVGEKIGGVVFYDGQVKLARCFLDAGVVSGVVRDRNPLGPRSEPVGSRAIPNNASGPDAVLPAL